MNLKPKVEQVPEQEENQTPKGVGPFDYTKNIENSTEWIMNSPEDEKGYVPFIINRSLSMGTDTLFQADEMNRAHHIPKAAQYAFLMNTIEKKKRFNKWLKREKQENIEIVKEFYGYGDRKAEQALSILTKDQIEELKAKLNKGGKQ